MANKKSGFLIAGLLWAAMGSAHAGGTIHFRGAIVEPTCAFQKIGSGSALQGNCRTSAGPVTWTLDASRAVAAARAPVHSIEVMPVYAPQERSGSDNLVGRMVVVTYI